MEERELRAQKQGRNENEKPYPSFLLIKTLYIIIWIELINYCNS